MKGQLLFLWMLCFGLLLKSQPVADFKADTTKGCAPVSIRFINQSTGQNLTYRWTFGNGNYSVLEHPEAIYYQAGKYTVTLEVTDSANKRSAITKTAYIEVFKNPTADFSGNPLSGCVPLSSQFANLSTPGDGPIKTWIWDFGDGNTSRDSNPAHTFKAVGRFHVSLVVKDINLCESKIQRIDYVETNQTPEIKIGADRTFYCKAPFAVQFSDLSSGTSSGDNFLWDFGDGNTSTARNPQHTYQKSGSFSVTLKVTKSNGCSSTGSNKDMIKVGSLLPNFSADKTKACVPAIIQFTNQTAPVMQGLQYEWDFGDGTKSGGLSVSHEYTKPGTYTVTLKAIVDKDCQETMVKTAYINIENGPEPYFTLSDSISCKSPFKVVASSNSSNYSQLNWKGDGKANGSLDQVLFTFQEEGEHTIDLIATNAIGCTKTFAKKVLIETPKVDIDASKRRGCAPLTVVFKDLITTFDSVIDKTWYFGEGTFKKSMDSSVTFTFTKDTVYKVKLYITTLSGCQANKEIEIRVGLKTHPDFVSVKDTICNKTVYTFQNTSKPNGVTIHDTIWMMGKGTPNEVFSKRSNGTLKSDHDSGWYNIALITVNNGCEDTIIKENQIYIAPPWAKMDVSSLDMCFTDSVVLLDKSIGGDSMVWLIKGIAGGPISLPNQKKLVLYPKQDGAVVLLKVFNFRFGCIDSMEKKIEFPKEITEAVINYYGNFCAPATLNVEAVKKSHYAYMWFTEMDSFTGPDHKIVYDKPGKYALKLRVNSKNSSCWDTASMSFEVTGPVVDGDVTFTEGCAPLNIQLICKSNPVNFKSLYWSIAGEKITISSAGTLQHTLLKPGPDANGIYKIRLIGIDSNGCQGLLEFPVKVHGVIGADIKIRRFSDCQALSYIFQTVSPGWDPELLKVKWDFGDGNFSNELTNNKTYSKAGIYPLSLTITDSNGCVSKVDYPLDIEKERAYADFKADSMNSDCPPLFVQFKDLSTSAGKRIVKWFWDFGDGSTSVEQNPSKLYLFAGKFTVTLIIENETGCRDTVVFPDFVLVNGPVGDYNFDKKMGCAPLEVNFTSRNVRATKLQFDMGDGQVYKNLPNPSHTYHLPGTYIPLMILSDTFGCTYAMPPKDTIRVFPYPSAFFDYEGTCYGYPVKFKPVTTSDTGLTYLWEFQQNGRIDSSIKENPEYVFGDDGMPGVKLKVTNKAGCSGSFEQNIKLKTIRADFNTTSQFNCVGNTIEVQSTGFSDTALTAYQWYIDTSRFFGNKVALNARQSGPVLIRLIVTNVLGCTDTFDSEKVVIGDTVPPVNVEMLRVTVLDDESIQLDHKKSVMPDFNAYLYYVDVDDSWEPVGMQNGIDQTSFELKNLNTLSNVYCVKTLTRNACGLVSNAVSSAKHCTIETKAIGEVNRAVVSWTPYVGWNQVEKYEVWREEMDNQGNYAYLGETDGNTLAYIDSQIICHASHHYKIKGIEAAGNLQVSFSDTCEAAPLWINTVPPPELIRATVIEDRFIEINWDSVINPKVPIDHYVIEKSENGSQYSICGSFNSAFSSNDRNVKVDDQSYFYRAYAVDVCDDTSGYHNFGKTILLKADTSGDQRPLLSWSTYQGWVEEVDYYTIDILNPDGSFSLVGDSRALDSTWIDLVTNLNQRPEYCYRITGFRNRVAAKPEVISQSNVDCSPVYSRIYVPNAFTPNQDQVNEKFKTPGIYIIEYHIRIYNRWGEKVFEGFNMDDNWDGTYQGKPCQQDAYAVIVETIGVDRVKRAHYGTITLLR